MRTLIGTIYVHLPDYQFYDSPMSGSPAQAKDGKYMDRSAIEGQIRSRLATGTNSRSGAILVTGYRGSGKTSVVRKVIRDLRDKKLKERSGAAAQTYHHAEINLAQDDIDERVILRLIAIELHRIFQQVRDPWMVTWDRERTWWPTFASKTWQWNKFLRFMRFVFPFLFFFGTVWASFNWFQDWCLLDRLIHGTGAGTHTHGQPDDGFFQVDHVINLFNHLLFPLLIAFGAYALVGSIERRYLYPAAQASMRQLRKRLELLISRMEAEVTRESFRGVNSSPVLNLFSIGHRETEFYPFVKTKEVELELIDVLKLFGKLCPHEQVIFVVDELDKLIPHSNISISERDQEDPSDDVPFAAGRQGIRGHENDMIRSRQQAIQSLFANLKHFLNVAEAKFVFIGSRELYDSVMADASNRDPFFGSIFSDVIYVPSFLKEVQENDRGRVEGLTTTTERFIAECVLTRDQRAEVMKGPVGRIPSLGPILGYMHRYRGNEGDTKGADGRELHRAYVALQELTAYLTFRGNGIAKRTIQLFEQNVVQVTEEQLHELLAREHQSDVVLVGTRPEAMTSGLYLRLSATSQYSHHLLSYFYRPFISINTRYYGSLSDKQLVSFTYVLDHLFKFHSFSFNYSNLELAPETIAVNKLPEMRKFLNDILHSLSQNHLRVIDNGLFNFQFFKKIYHEIAYLSKISEQDAAAMNFTLDESLPVKQHFYKRLYHMIGLENERKAGSAIGLADAIPALHQLLGDLHYFDEEYDEALAQYRAATRIVEEAAFSKLRRDDRPRKGEEAAADPPSDRHGVRFREYVKLILKQCICLEKVQAYDDAFALSNGLSQDICEYLRPRVPRVLGDGTTMNSTAPLSLKMVSSQSSALRTGMTDFVGTQEGAMEEIIVGWRLFILAIAHRLALAEKSSRGGILKVDLVLVEDFLKSMTAAFDSRMIGPRLQAALYQYLASILHFSNIVRSPVSPYTINGRAFCHAQDLYRRALVLLITGQDEPAVDTVGLTTFRQRDMVEEAWENLIDLRKQRNDALFATEGVNRILEQAGCLSKFGDTMFHTTHAHTFASLNACEFFGHRFTTLCNHGSGWWMDGQPVHGPGGSREHFTPPPTVAQTLLMAAELYDIGTQSIRSVFQIKKLFYYVFEVVSNTMDKAVREALLKDMQKLVEIAKGLSHKANGHIDRPQQEKARYHWEHAHHRVGDEVHAGAVSYRSELVEMDCLYHELALKLDIDCLPGAVHFLNLNGKDSSLQLTRMRQLILSMRIDKIDLLKVCGLDEAKDSILADQAEPMEVVAQRVRTAVMACIYSVDERAFVESVSGAIYSATHLIRLLNLYGLSFMTNQSTLAWAHVQLGDLCLLLMLMTDLTDQEDARRPTGLEHMVQRIHERIGRTLDRKAISRLDPVYHYTHALNLLERTSTLHSRGRTFRRVMADMSLPEEDYSDTLYHYACSLERRRMVNLHARDASGRLASLIKRLEPYNLRSLSPQDVLV